MNLLRPMLVLSVAMCSAISLASDRGEKERDALEVSAFKAAMVAFENFQARLPNEKAEPGAVGKLLSNEDNYTVHVRDTPQGYEVLLLANPPPDFQEFRGGGYQYLIDKTTHEIKYGGRMK